MQNWLKLNIIERRLYLFDWIYSYGLSLETEEVKKKQFNVLKVAR